MWDLIASFLNSNDDFIKSIATQLNGYKQQLDAGQISKIEFQDLSHDLLDMQNIANAGLDLDRQTAATEAFNEMVEIVGNVA